MVDKEFTFVLGARAPQMREIGRVLRRTNRAFVHAARDRLPVSARPQRRGAASSAGARSVRGFAANASRESLAVARLPAHLQAADSLGKLAPVEDPRFRTINESDLIEILRLQTAHRVR